MLILILSQTIFSELFTHFSFSLSLLCTVYVVLAAVLTRQFSRIFLFRARRRQRQVAVEWTTQFDVEREEAKRRKNLDVSVFFSWICSLSIFIISIYFLLSILTRSFHHIHPPSFAPHPLYCYYLLMKRSESESVWEESRTCPRKQTEEKKIR